MGKNKFNLKLLIAVSLSFFVSIPSLGIEESPHHHCVCELAHHHNPVVVKENSILSITDCISIGIQNSPIVKEYEHRYELAKSNVGVAKSTYFPSLSVGAGLSQSYNSNHEDFFSNYKEYPTFGVMLNKMIWDFGKTTANIRMEEYLRLAAQYEFEDTVCSTVFDIKKKYYGVLRANALFEAAKINLKTHEKLVAQISNSSVSKSKTTDLLNARIQVLEAKKVMLEAEDNFQNAKEDLNNSMYLVNAPRYSIFETQTFNFVPEKGSQIKNVSNVRYAKIQKDNTIFEHPKFSQLEAVKLAYQNSPDLKVLLALKNAMEQSLLMIKRTYYPEINGNLGYNILNTNQYSNNEFGVGVNVASSLNAMKQRYDVKGAKAQLDIAQDTVDKFKKDLYFRVRKALNRVNETQLIIPIAKDEEKIAVKNLSDTQNAYNSGTMNQLELQNSAISYYNSLLSDIDSQYRYNIALIELEMAMHYHLIDYHEKSEHSIEFHDENASDNLSKMINCKKKHVTE